MTKFCKKCSTETIRSKRGTCVPCAKARGIAWRAANPDRRRAAEAVYTAANKEKIMNRKRAYRAANAERLKAYHAAYELANAERIKARREAYRKANPEKATAPCRAWNAANPEARRIHKQNRRARENAYGGKLSVGLVSRLLILQRGKCPCCQQPLGKNFHLDHIVPLALGGANTDDNMQLLTQRCNNQKHAKHPVSFMQERGFLL